MQKKYKRLFLIVSLFFVALSVTTVLLSNLRDNITFFYYPSELSKIDTNKYIRMGGMVESESLQVDGTIVKFIIYDSSKKMQVTYKGVLPLLFGKDVEVIVGGKAINHNEFLADKLFTKHNEVYTSKKKAQKSNS